jgi:hypothetical protein
VLPAGEPRDIWYAGSLEREAVMAGVVKVEKFERDELGGAVAVTLEVRTPAGQFTYPMRFPDQGSMNANERQAFLELQKHLEEALEVIRQQLGDSSRAGPAAQHDRDTIS